MFKEGISVISNGVMLVFILKCCICLLVCFVLINKELMFLDLLFIERRFRNV